MQYISCKPKVFLDFIFISLLLLLIRPVFYPLIFALCVYYITFPCVIFFKRYLFISEKQALCLTFVLLVTSVFIFLKSIFPIFLSEGIGFFNNVSIFFTSFNKGFVNLAIFIANKFNIIIKPDDYINNSLKSLLASDFAILANAFSMLENTAVKMYQMFIILFNVFLACIFYFYIGLNRLFLFNIIVSFAPFNYRSQWLLFLDKINDIFSSYLRGQIILVHILMLTYTIFFVCIGFPYPLLLGPCIGTFGFIPYLSTVFGIFMGLFILLSNSSSFFAYMIFLVGMFFIGIMEIIVLIPYFIGKVIGLNPFSVFLAVLIGGSYFGILGVITCVLLAAMWKIFFYNFISYAKKLEVV